MACLWGEKEDHSIGRVGASTYLVYFDPQCLRPIGLVYSNRVPAREHILIPDGYPVGINLDASPGG